MTFDVTFLVNIFRYFGSLVDKLPFQMYDRGSLHCTVIREPFGVCAGIIPFNWPPVHTGGKLAPALAAGNTMIIKPGEQAPLTCIRIVEIISSILPSGVVQVVPGIGPEVPQVLVRSPDVHRVSFTGSTRTGVSVAVGAAESIMPLTLELGGKNPTLVFSDADLEAAVRTAAAAAFENQGEVGSYPSSNSLMMHCTDHLRRYAYAALAYTSRKTSILTSSLASPHTSKRHIALATKSAQWYLCHTTAKSEATSSSQSKKAQTSNSATCHQKLQQKAIGSLPRS